METHVDMSGKCFRQLGVDSYKRGLDFVSSRAEKYETLAIKSDPWVAGKPTELDEKTQKWKFVFPSRETSLLCLSRARQTNCRHDLGERKCLLKDPRTEQSNYLRNSWSIEFTAPPALTTQSIPGWISLSPNVQLTKNRVSRNVDMDRKREFHRENIFRPEPSQDME